MRINHWSVAISIFVLIVTGFYIADPLRYTKEKLYTNFLWAMFVLSISCSVLFSSFCPSGGFIWPSSPVFHADWRDFLAWTDVKATIEQIKFYLLISDHPEKKYLYGPMQALAYIGCWFMVVVIIVTGLILMGAGYHAGLTSIASFV